MEKYRQQGSRYYQKSGSRSGCRMNSSCGNQSAWEDKDVTLKCKCDCDCSLVSPCSKGACPVPGDCPEVEADPLAGFPIAMAYVPWQRCKQMYDENEALYHGTLFPELDLGFYGKRC